MTPKNTEVTAPAAVDEQEATMTSLELRDIINASREEQGESRVENSHFLKRIEDELEGELGLRKVFVNPEGGRPAGYYELTRDQCTLVGMRESKAVRRSVLAKLKEVEQHTAHLQNQMTEAQALESAKTLLRREINIFRDHIHSDLESNLFTFQKVTKELNSSGQYKRTLKQASTYAMAVNAGWITGDHQNTRKHGEFFVRRDTMPTGGRTRASFRLKLTRLGRAKLLQPDLDESTLIRDYLMHLPSNIQDVPGVRKIEIVNHIIAEWEKNNWEPVDFPIEPLRKLAGHLDGSTRLLG